MLTKEEAMPRWSRAGFFIVVIFLATGAELDAQERPLDSHSEYRAVLETYLMGWQTRNVAYFEEVLSPDFVDYMYGVPRTREELLVQGSMPDRFERRISIDDMIVSGDTVVVRITNHIRHPPTGKTAQITGMIIARIVDGKMVEGWGVHDRLGQYLQLNLLTAEELSERVAARLGQPPTRP
jgi:predicted SnoaL-like aldol condensation-catalyzing enzyme